MKVILTEQQLELVKLIKESTEFGDKVKEKIKDINTRIHKMYNLVTYTTIAEYRDSNGDGPITRQKFEVLENELEVLDRNVEDFQNRYMDKNHDWANPMAEEMYADLEGRIYKLEPKMKALGELTETLVHILHDDIHNPFKSIKPMDI